MQHILDYKAETLFTHPDYTKATLSVTIWPDNSKPLYGEYHAKVTLYDAEQNKVTEMDSRPFAECGFYLMPKFIATVTAPVENPALWTAETPTLYTLVVELQNKENETVDIESCKVGFRQVEINSRGVLTLNGKRLVIRGVDRHDFCAETGRTVSEEQMRKEIAVMKRLNFNAVRTSHYPNSVKWYDLCDELGIYLVDETNLETHGYGGQLSASAEWTAAYLERATRMVLRDKNHPSIVLWSLGNESGAGANHAAMHGWIREYDKTRYVQYESGNPKSNISDVICPMYPTMSWLEDVMADDSDLRPFIMCEYAYAKSNSNGNFREFWDYVNKYPRFQGGFIWDFADKAIAIHEEDGNIKYGYGGAFGEDVTDPVPDMCLNGVVFADLSYKPGAYEVRNGQSPVTIEQVKNPYTGETIWVLANRYHTLDLSHLQVRYEIVQNGETLAKGSYPTFYTAAGTTETLPLPELPAKLHGEAYVNYYVELAQDTFYAPAGTELYRRQIPVTSGVYLADEKTIVGKPLTVSEDENHVRITGEETEIIFDKKTGEFTRYQAKSVSFMTGGKDEFYRAPTGIDEGTHESDYDDIWRAEGLDRLKKEYASERKTSIENAKAAVFEEKKMEEAEVVVLIDRFGYTRSVDLSVYERNKESADAESRFVVHCLNTDKLCIFTDTGRLHLLKVADLPYGRFRDKGTPLDNLCNYSSTEEEILRIEGLNAVKSTNLLFATQQSMIKKVEGTEFDVSKRTIASTKLTDGDKLIAVLLIGEEEQIVLQSTDGYFLRFMLEEVPVKKKAAIGVRGMKMNAKDQLLQVHLLTPNGDDIAIYKDKEVHLNRLRISKRDAKAVKTRVS